MNLDNFAMRCEREGIYNIESEMSRPCLWVMGGGEIGLINTESKIRVPVCDVPILIEELQGLYEDYKLLERQGRTLTKNDKRSECISLINLGYSNRQIADKLGWSISKVNGVRHYERRKNGD